MYAAVSLPNMRWLVWLGLIPMGLLFDRGLPCWFAHLGAFLTCLVYYALTSLWVEQFAYGVLGPAAVVGAGLSASLVLAPLAAARYVRRRIGVPSVVLLSLTCVISDGIRGIVFRPFIASGLLLVPAGLALADYPRLFQVVGLGGVSAATLVVAAVNGSLADLAASIFHGDQHKGFSKPSLSLAVSAALLVPAWGYGALVMRDQAVHPDVRVALVASKFPASRTCGLCSVEADVFVWPEGTIERSFPRSFSRTERTRSSSATFGTPVDLAKSLNGCIIVGVDRFQSSPCGNATQRFNSLFIYDPHEGRAKSYDKIYLVPFAEFEPSWGWLLSALRVHMTMELDGTPSTAGERLVPIAVSVGDRSRTSIIAPFVCYDVFFPDLHREYFRQQAQPDVFIACASEVLEPSGALTALSLLQLRCRAAEFRRPYFRVSYGGTNAIVDRFGRIFAARSHAPGETFVLTGAEGTGRGRTVYCIVGEFVSSSASGVMIALLILASRRRVRAAARVQEPDIPIGREVF